MNREEKKEWIKINKDRIKLNFNCGGIDCRNCPFLGTICGVNKEMDDLLFEVLAEEKGYIKDEVADLKKIVVDPSKIGPTITVKDTTDKQLNPDHYKVGKLQAIEQMMIVFGPSKVANFCEVNAFKYHARAGLKGDASLDHKKADWYLRLANALGDADTVFLGMNLLKEFLKEEEEKNGRNSD